MRHQTYETLEGVLARVVDEDARKVDLIADTRKMSFGSETTSTLTVDLDEEVGGLRDFELNDHTLGQLSTDLEIPKKYFDRLRNDAPDLFRENVHHWLTSEPNRRMVRGRTNDDGTTTGRAWLSDRYRRLDNIEIARTLLPEFETLGTEVKFHNAAVTESSFYLRATFPQWERAVKVGDPVCWGVQIRNSEVGAGKFSISGFVNRLRCTNGLVTSEELNARHVGRRLDGEGIFTDETLAADDTAFWLAARDTLRATLSETRFAEVVEKLTDAAESERIEKPVEATKVLGKTFELTEGETDEVLRHLYEGHDLTKWGALNAITRAAQDVESFERRVELETIGWDVANMTNREWAKVAAAA